MVHPSNALGILVYGGEDKPRPHIHDHRWKISAIGLAHARSRSSAIAGAITCKPRGRPFLALPAGSVRAGMPACVQGRFMSVLPVEVMPSGAGPMAVGQIQRSTPSRFINVSNLSRT